jgi:hypothetical protein
VRPPEWDAVEVRTKREQAINFTKGETTEVVRVRYRPKGSKGRWLSFLLVPEEGQTLEWLEENAEEAALRVMVEHPIRP